MYERTLSLLASACLHLGVFVLVLFWPAPEPPELPTGTMVTGLVSFNPLEGTAGEPTRQDTPQPQKGNEQPAKPTDVEPQAVVEPVKPIEPVEPVKPIEPVEPVKPREPEPTPEDTATPIPETPEKKTPPQNATAQKTPVETKNATQEKTPEQKKPEQQKPPEQKKPVQNVDNALADLQQQTGQQRGKGKTTGSGSGQDLSNALADLGQQVGGSGGGAQGRGAGVQGGTGYGVAGAYEDSVVSRVKPNWAWPNRADRRNFVAVVNIKIAADGTIQSYTLKTSSGNPYFDSTVTNAIQATRILEPPPDSRFMDMDVSFSSEALSR